MSEKQHGKRVLRAIDAVMKWNPTIRLEARLDGESWYVKGTCVSCGRHADVFAVTVKTAKNTVGAYAFMTDIDRAVSGLLSQCSRRECETNKQTDAAHAIREATYKPVRTPAEILADDIDTLRKEFTGYEFGSPERHAAERAYEVPIKCACRWSSFFIDERDIEDGATRVVFRKKVRELHLLGCEHGRREMDDYKEPDACKVHGCVMFACNGHCCVSCMNLAKELNAQGWPNVSGIDPMDRLVDGLTVRECLERYTAWQRTRDKQSGGNTVYWVDGVRMVRPWDMTHEQVCAARLAWSAELKRKQQEAEAKERASVCVDDDRWEP